MAEANSRPTVIVVGAINVDLVVTAPRLPKAGETVVGDAMRSYGGGKGANAAVAAARAGARVILVGAVGDDENGRTACAELSREGVDVGGVAVLSEYPTGVALIVVDTAGENQIAVGAGANLAITAENVRAGMGASLPGAGCVLVSTEISPEAVAAAVDAASEAGVPCVLNPAPVLPVVVHLVDRHPLLSPNASESRQLAALAGCPGSVAGLPDAAIWSELADLVKAPVVITLGGEGAAVVEPGARVHRVPPRRVEVRDTTGAGDTFNGVLARWIAAGADLCRAAEIATAAASLSVTRLGARAGMPQESQIERACP